MTKAAVWMCWEISAIVRAYTLTPKPQASHFALCAPGDEDPTNIPNTTTQSVSPITLFSYHKLVNSRTNPPAILTLCTMYLTIETIAKRKYPLQITIFSLALLGFILSIVRLALPGTVISRMNVWMLFVVSLLSIAREILPPKSRPLTDWLG